MPELTGDRLLIEGVDAEDIARSVGTPTYVYSASQIRESIARVRAAFSPIDVEMRYAVKANGALALLELIRREGVGMDVVSGGELERAWLAGTPMNKVCFAGVGKTEPEIRAAIHGSHSPLLDRPDLAHRRDPTRRGPVGLLNIESAQELDRVARIARELGVTPRVCIRVNPDVDAGAHEYTTTGRAADKFGVPPQQAIDLFANPPSTVSLVGLHAHIGSPVAHAASFARAVSVLLEARATLADRGGHAIQVLNIGGGWPSGRVGSPEPTLEEAASVVVPLLEEAVHSGVTIIVEPGRAIVATAGVLLTRVQYVKPGKDRHVVVCDAGMHTLIRPALYGAHHLVWPVGAAPPPTDPTHVDGGNRTPCDIVGPICESADFLARDRLMPPVKQGDLLALFDAGAYGMSMASSYNSHGRPAEVLVDTDGPTVIRKREGIADLVKAEIGPEPLPSE